jgi:hypothetical protein
VAFVPEALASESTSSKVILCGGAFAALPHLDANHLVSIIGVQISAYAMVSSRPTPLALVAAEFRILHTCVRVVVGCGKVDSDLWEIGHTA